MTDINNSQETTCAYTSCHTEMGREGLVNAARNCQNEANIDFEETNIAKFDKVS